MKKIFITGLAAVSMAMAFGQNYVGGPEGVYGPQWNPATTVASGGSVYVGTGGNWFFGGVVSSRSGPGQFQFDNTGIYSNASATGYVDGQVARTGTGDFTLPIGNPASALVYNPLSVTAAASTLNVAAVYFVSTPPNPTSLGTGISSVDPAEYWSFISGTNTATVTAAVRDETGVFSAGSVMALAGDSSATWQKLGAYSSTLAAQNLVSNAGSISLAKYSAFTAGGQAPLIVNAKAFLQGPANGTVMTTTLNSLGVLPMAQPYNLAPYGAAATGYAGTEAVASGFFAANPTIVDWVLLELRDASTPGSILGTRAAFIKSNGSIVDTNGTSTVQFTGIAAGNYYVSVRHRNHLGIRSTNAVAVAYATPLYDFTTAAAQANGTNAMVSAAGIFSMWAGNVEHTVNGSGLQEINYSASVSDVDQARYAVTNATGNSLHIISYAGASITGVYNVNDVNMDGNVRYSAGISDVDLIRANVTNFPTNTLHVVSFTNLVEKLP